MLYCCIVRISICARPATLKVVSIPDRDRLAGTLNHDLNWVHAHVAIRLGYRVGVKR